MTHRCEFRSSLFLMALFAAGVVFVRSAPAQSGETASFDADDPIKLFGGTMVSVPREPASDGVSASDRSETGLSADTSSADLSGAGSKEIPRNLDNAGTGVSRHREMPINKPGEDGWFSFRDVLPLLAVVALIVVLMWIVKRFMPGRNLLTGSSVLEVVARMPVSSKQHLVLVKMGRRLVLLGVTANEMTTLSVVDDPDQVALLLGEAASGRSDSITQAFSESFDEQARAYGEQDEGAGHDPVEVASGHLRGLMEKVRELAQRRRVA